MDLCIEQMAVLPVADAYVCMYKYLSRLKITLLSHQRNYISMLYSRKLLPFRSQMSSLVVLMNSVA